MTIHKLLWTQPATTVLVLIRDLAAYPPACDPWPSAWPYDNAWNAPTAWHGLYERTER